MGQIVSKLLNEGAHQAWLCIFGAPPSRFAQFVYSISLWCIQPVGERDRCTNDDGDGDGIYRFSGSTAVRWERAGE